MSNFKKYFLLAAFCIGAVMILNTLKEAEKKKASASGRSKSAGDQRIAVKTTPVITDTVETVIELNGRLYSYLETTIGSEVDGVVEDTKKEMGDPVAEKELLVKIKDVEYEIKYRQANLDYMQTLTKLSGETSSINISAFSIETVSSVKKARANADNLRSNLWRLNELRKNDLTSRQLLDDTENKLKAAEADLQFAREEAKNLLLTMQTKKAALDLAEKKLRDTSVMAPYSGLVQRRLVSDGEYVRVGTPLYSIIKIDPIKFIGGVPENYVSDISIGRTVEVSVDAAKGVFTGRVTRISPSSAPESHSVDIEVAVDNPGNVLKPGYFASGKIILNVNPKGRVIPTEALYIFAGVEKVFAVKDDKAFEKKVKLGRRFVDRIEIREGLDGSELLAVSNISKLYDGAAVKKPESEEKRQ